MYITYIIRYVVHDINIYCSHIYFLLYLSNGQHMPAVMRFVPENKNWFWFQRGHATEIAGRGCEIEVEERNLENKQIACVLIPNMICENCLHAALALGWCELSERVPHPHTRCKCCDLLANSSRWNITADRAEAAVTV